MKKAPFVVLIGAQMPSILAEISFLTNPDDAEQLREGPYRQRVAEALDAGVERYLRGLSGTRRPRAPQSATKGRPGSGFSTGRSRLLGRPPDFEGGRATALIQLDNGY